MSDTNITPQIKVRVRTVCIHKNKVLLVINDRDNFSYIPGGKLEPFESIPDCAKREIKEELGEATEFTFKKVLWISEFQDRKRNIHSVELFILGTLNKFEELQGLHDPEHNGEDHFEWVEIDNLPKDLKPEFLQDKLPNLLKKHFDEDVLYF